MFEILLLVYIINLTLLICHEIESAYWQEWKLFKLPGEITGFVILHIPLLLLLLWGIILINNHSKWGLVLSLALCFGGLFAFFAHSHFIKKGEEGFNLKISAFLLNAIFLTSIVQLIIQLILSMKLLF